MSISIGSLRDIAIPCEHVSRGTVRISGPGQLMFHSLRLASPAPLHAMVRCLYASRSISNKKSY
ncbi:hypothetical protein, partial [Rubripirellula tenax]|uniref:hypothetical protein n=1 Tax=Rubripirellula tenax TaxID=2528015 RepID=UPI001C9888D8